VNRYLIRLTYENGGGHFETQAEQRRMIYGTIGVSSLKWYQGGPGDTHTWEVRCDEEQLLMLKLNGAQIISNLTAKFRESGLAKLNEDEKEALGIKE
jgi:hypothetical protein